MAEIRRTIEKIIERDPVIRKGLQRGIINSRGLARYIQDTGRLDATTDAILGVIRRYPLAGEGPERSPVLENSGLAMRSRMADLTLYYRSGIMKQIAELESSIGIAKSEKPRIIEGSRSIRILGDQKTVDWFRQNLPREDVIQYLDNLVEISISLTSAAVSAKGVYARITAELALNDVNLVGIACYVLEVSLLVEEKNATKAIETLHNMISDDASIAAASGLHKKSRIVLTTRN